MNRTATSHDAAIAMLRDAAFVLRLARKAANEIRLDCEKAELARPQLTDAGENVTLTA